MTGSALIQYYHHRVADKKVVWRVKDCKRLLRKRLHFRNYNLAFPPTYKRMPPKKANFRNTQQQRGQAAGMQNNTGQKIRLRRNVSNNKQAVIQQNLSHMEQQAQKKKIAQEYYYQNKLGQSPMRRGAQSLEDDETIKAPVHNRLGNKIRLIRTTATKQLATTSPPLQVKNRIRLQRVRPQQPVLKRPGFPLNAEKVMRVYSAQNRLSRIRQGASFTTQRGNMQRGVVQRAMMIQSGLVNQRIRLRRNRPQPGGAINYTVQVANNAVVKNRKHHVGSQLNPTLQQEIRMIQNKSIPQNIVSNEAVHPVGTGVTSKSLHERFSEL